MMLTEHKCNLLAKVVRFLSNRSILTFPFLHKILRCNRYLNNKFNSQIHMLNMKISINLNKPRRIVLSLEQVHTI
jgi:hypothetical protein